jgi:hypothetical protein
MYCLKFFIFTLLALFLLTGCEEDIDLSLKGDKPRLVVDGVITTDTMAHRVKLSLSGDYFDNQPMPRVSGAVVTLSDGVETFVLKESQDNPGEYLTSDNFYGRQNTLYSLEISNVDVNADGQAEVYTSESYLNPVIEIDSVSIGFHRIWKLWQINLHAHDPAGDENFYLFNLYINGELYSDRYSKMSYTDDRFFDGSYADGVWIFSLDAEDEEENLVPGDVVTLESLMVEKNYYDFVNAAEEETEDKTPLFSGPPANVPSNISNGALGQFAAYSISRYSVVNASTVEDMIENAQ